MTLAGPLRPLLLILMLGLVSPALAAGFLASLDDVPLMPGLVEKPQSALLFDAPAGRIAEAEAEGPVASDKILSFYATTLPELGWEKVAPTVFRREAEQLTLQLDRAATGTTVRFRISPEK